jgi:hypothetical protein
MTYAENTSVPADRSRAEIERTLQRYGASKFMYGYDEEHSMIAFVANNRQVRFILPMPDRDDPRFTMTPSGRKRRDANSMLAEYEKATRQRWRALALVIKAKLEAVESGITVFEDEFLAHIVLPDGSTAGDWMRPQIEKAYEKNKMPPPLMLALPSGEES